MKSSGLSSYADQLLGLLIAEAPRIALSLLGLVVGWKLIKRAVVVFGNAAKNLDPTLLPFLQTLLAWSLRIVLLISVASSMGVPVASFMAVLGTAGLAVGLALQGSLSNFAGGVMLLVFRPYKVGDLIEAQGKIGVVKEIQIFNTTLVDADKRRVIIPNGPMFSGNIVNYNVEGIRRIDVTIGISYDSDIDQARRVLLEMMLAHPSILKEPPPTVEVLELADSSVNLAVRPFSASADYWRVYVDTREFGKKALDAAGISIPFPQRDVHLHNVVG